MQTASNPRQLASTAAIQTFMVEADCGTEALHTTSTWSILLLSMDAHIAPAILLGKTCTLHTTLADGIGNSMRQCAADQGHAKSATQFGLNQKLEGDFLDALKYFQIAVASGDATTADSLAEAFGSQFHADEVYGLGQSVDIERFGRYKKISKFLSDYDYLNPKVPEIDTILPLPPAKLPAWDGKLQWLEAHKANVSPPLPTEERIAEMARAKGLDPKTGRAVGIDGK